VIFGVSTQGNSLLYEKSTVSATEKLIHNVVFIKTIQDVLGTSDCVTKSKEPENPQKTAVSVLTKKSASSPCYVGRGVQQLTGGEGWA
jgi:hypothetical protein